MHVLTLLLLTGCVSPQEQGLKTEHGWRVVEDIPAGSRVTLNQMQAGAVKQCDHKHTSEAMAELRKADPEQSWFYDCKDIVPPQLTPGPSIASQTQGAVGLAAAGAAIGTGLALSGDDVTNHNNATGGSARPRRHRR